ncbi:Asp23/Gls24 family envelope stress response protein [Streptomyces sp. CAI-21]|uniref:Asp23/Gls24 family envelope stress response protein n=1 Tax=Streptomyces TaxID=1883 RepID=UPI0005273CD8|nr:MULTISPECIES: Asp23/Gls24 family envelope stress response protein [Streptomyces]MBO1284396.1 Asp23/Gls24 family envelope stress response protein [Streptomyces sampsonii]NUW05803.1 Asp23/Gls24 family envelope stress response protein [Streptomyces sp. CAI-21]NVI32085.1 Asp23/Gls24 family envelope stress response protein [Streptomyces sp. CAI-17]MCX5456877.1 Asp23/Gls24 family envelope stress response protein [Streptomyces sp. FT1]WAC97649.1 Asp23/Gls24 family envelope stress response protein 
MNNRPPDTSTPDHEDETLPCGRPLSRVWADWEDRADDGHAAACPHCRLATADLERLESRVRALDTASGQAQPDTTSLVHRVMDVVRLELRPGRPLPLGEADEDTWIMENVAARVLRGAAEEVPGVRAGSCRLIPRDGAGAGPVDVILTVQVPLTTPGVPALADEIRGRVDNAADQLLGLRLGAIDVHVRDLVPDGNAEQGGGPS